MKGYTTINVTRRPSDSFSGFPRAVFFLLRLVACIKLSCVGSPPLIQIWCYRGPEKLVGRRKRLARIPCTRRRTIISGLVSLLRMRLIRSLRSFGVRVSVMVRELCPAVDRTALSLARAVETVKSVEAKNLRS